MNNNSADKNVSDVSENTGDPVAPYLDGPEWLDRFAPPFGGIAELHERPGGPGYPEGADAVEPAWTTLDYIEQAGKIAELAREVMDGASAIDRLDQINCLAVEALTDFEAGVLLNTLDAAGLPVTPEAVEDAHRLDVTAFLNRWYSKPLFDKWLYSDPGEVDNPHVQAAARIVRAEVENFHRHDDYGPSREHFETVQEAVRQLVEVVEAGNCWLELGAELDDLYDIAHTWYAPGRGYFADFQTPRGSSPAEVLRNTLRYNSDGTERQWGGEAR
jgi:hypothetical protein